MDAPGTAAMAKAYCTKEYGEDHCTHVTFGALSKQRSMRDKLNDSDDAGEDGAQVWCNPRAPVSSSRTTSPMRCTSACTCAALAREARMASGPVRAAAWPCVP